MSSNAVTIATLTHSVEARTGRRATADDVDSRVVSLRALPRDWAAMRTLSLWLVHTPAGAATILLDGVPAAASTSPTLDLPVCQNRAASARVRPAAAVQHA